MTYKKARVYLDKLSKYGSVLSLDAIRELLRELGNPQDDLKFIHIAGTNGKGSILAYISTILSEAGFRTGRYVSPTVNGYLEMIQIDGRWISEEVFAELVEEVQKAIVRMKSNGKESPTIFEVETAIAFLYFQKMHCDYVVLETGLGGGMDATNVVKTTKAAVFATVSRDHMGFLGDTLEEIAKEKAGIMKPGCKVISAAQEDCVREVFEQKAKELDCSLSFAAPEKVEITEESYQGQTFLYRKNSSEKMNEVEISLAGRYQIINAITAIEAVRALEEERITEEIIQRGLKKTVWKGRFTCISENPVFIVDGAHNQDAAVRLKETLETYFPGKQLIYIMGVFKDKEYEKIVELTAPMAKCVYTIDLPNQDRTLSKETLKETVENCWKKLSLKHTNTEIQKTETQKNQTARIETEKIETQETETVQREVLAMDSVEAAVQAALQRADKEDVILAFGSLSYLGEVMQTVCGTEEGICENDES